MFGRNAPIIRCGAFVFSGTSRWWALRQRTRLWRAARGSRKARRVRHTGPPTSRRPSPCLAAGPTESPF